MKADSAPAIKIAPYDFCAHAQRAIRIGYKLLKTLESLPSCDAPLIGVIRSKIAPLFLVNGL